MKKRFLMLSAALLLLFALAVPAFAADVPPTGGVPAKERLYPLLVDDAHLLSEAEEAELLAKLEEISARQKMDIAVITVAQTDDRTIEAYTDDFYDYFGYGQGSAKDGVMLLIDMGSREAHMTAVGRGIGAFTDAGRAYILDNAVMPLISSGAYADAFNEFAEQCDAFIRQADTGKPYDGSFMPKGGFKPLSIMWLIAAAAAGLIAAAIVSAKLKKEMKTVELQHGAGNYAVNGSLVITGKTDRFVTNNITRTERARESGSSGSTTHTSSSGQTHSGTSRKF